MVLALLAAILWPVVGHAEGGDPERRAAACWLGLGRPAMASERALLGEAGAMTELLAGWRDQLRADAVARRAVAVRAWWDALGRAPREAELAPAAAELYVERVRELVDGLAARPEEYRAVVERAYHAVLGRAPFPEEFQYWGEDRPRAYVVLVGCLENWARRNAPGLTVTTGVPAISATSERLATLRLSPALADEVRRALAWPMEELARARGANVLMPGGDTIVSVGGVHFIAIGRDVR